MSLSHGAATRTPGFETASLAPQYCHFPVDLSSTTLRGLLGNYTGKLGVCNYMMSHWCEPLLSLRLMCTTEHWPAGPLEANLAVFAHEMLLAASA